MSELIKQLYFVGDIVEVHHLPKSMSHFNKGVAQITEVSHNSCQEGNDWEWSYGLNFVEGGRSCWYYHSNISLSDVPKLPDYQLLLLSRLLPRTGDEVTLTNNDLFFKKGSKGLITGMEEDGQYYVAWNGGGSAAWYNLSDFEGYEEQTHPLEYMSTDEDEGED
jgi:hypothetical protein